MPDTAHQDVDLKRGLLLLLPIFNAKAWYPVEFTRVVGGKDQVTGTSMAGNHLVVRADGRGGFPVEVEHFQSCGQAFDNDPIVPRFGGALRTKGQFHPGDATDTQLLTVLLESLPGGGWPVLDCEDTDVSSPACRSAPKLLALLLFRLLALFHEIWGDRRPIEPGIPASARRHDKESIANRDDVDLFNVIWKSNGFGDAYSLTTVVSEKDAVHHNWLHRDWWFAAFWPVATAYVNGIYIVRAGVTPFLLSKQYATD